MRDYDHGGDIYGNPGVALDFSANTNPMGMPEAVRNTLTARVDEFARYPDPYCRGLRAAIARHEDVPEDWIICGNGAADLIYRLCHAVRPGRGMVFDPTFSEYERAIKQAGGIVSNERPDIIFICHPNNPTGRLAEQGDILDAARTGAITVVDECFLDFTEGESAKKHLSELPNLAILKAFTKMYAMAGLRLGYLLCADLGLLGRINAAGQCWSVSVPAQIAGVAALGCTGWVEETRRLVAEERQFLSTGLRGIGIKVYPSDANFLLLRCETPLYGPLLNKGMLIRRCENFKGLDGSYYRVGVKTRNENIRLLQAIKEVMHG